MPADTLAGRCRDCRWWIQLDDEPKWGLCVSASQGGELENMIQSDELHTREDFGCVGFGGKADA